METEVHKPDFSLQLLTCIDRAAFCHSSAGCYPRQLICCLELTLAVNYRKSTGTSPCHVGKQADIVDCAVKLLAIWYSNVSMYKEGKTHNFLQTSSYRLHFFLQVCALWSFCMCCWHMLLILFANTSFLREAEIKSEIRNPSDLPSFGQIGAANVEKLFVHCLPVKMPFPFPAAPL